MSWAYARIAEKPGRVLAWSALMAITLVLAFLVQALAARTLAQEPGVPPAACQSDSPATAALADGDDVRARFLVTLCSRTGGAALDSSSR